MFDVRSLIPRRGFLATAASAAAAVTLPWNRLDAAPAPQGGPDDWINGLKGAHRQVFDGPDPAGGIMLIHMLNYYNTYNNAYGVADAEINAVGTFYGGTTLHGLNDAMWAKYRLGEFLNINDPDTNAPAVKNPWRTNPEILGMRIAAASVEALQRRGSAFILCNNALTFFARSVAQARGLQADAVYNDMKANMIPGVVLVPGMVVALEKAQKAGMTYQRQ